MVSSRSGFGLTTVGDKLFATGGIRDSGEPVESVEVFSTGEGWRQKPEMEMRVTKYSHCSVAIGTWLYTIGGLLGGKLKMTSPMLWKVMTHQNKLPPGLENQT